METKRETAPPIKHAARLIAYYLPQFYPIKENNEWWGEGFTEWTNVTRALPLFRGHLQPRLPRDLGFYDLRVAETRQHQADLARQAGIEGFCYWHYWFGNGRRIMTRPFDEVLASGQPNFPFCLAWANQTWSGIWYGEPKRVLIEQTYPNAKDEEAHFNAVLPAFRDPRYIKIDGKPLFLIYDPNHMPNTASFIDHWRRLASMNGLDGIHFTAMTVNFNRPYLKPFDSVTSFGPGDFLHDLPKDWLSRFRRRFRRRDFGPIVNKCLPRYLGRPSRFHYEEVVRRAFISLPRGERYHPCVLPGWDNTPRSGNRGVVFERATPELFSQYIKKALLHTENVPQEKRIIFVKAWNEWAEGNFLEPDQIHGHAFLDVIHSEIVEAGSKSNI